MVEPPLPAVSNFRIRHAFGNAY